MSPAAVRLGAVEGGGSKFRCAVAQWNTGAEPAPAQVKFEQQVVITTAEPEQTLQQVSAFFHSRMPLAGLGIACFGPLGVDPSAADYGHLLDTPKTAWQGTNLLAPLRGLNVPLRLHTDVVAAALAEYAQAAPPPPLMTYITVGTGIGAGVLVHGEPLPPGGGHGEFGHQYVQRHPQDTFAGVCPFHGDCLEGLASAVAMQQRWGSSPELINSGRAWRMQAFYLAQGCVNLLRVLGPQRIMLGGGIMRRTGLHGLVLEECRRLLADYYAPGPQQLAEMIVPPALGDDAGLLGAVWLARR